MPMPDPDREWDEIMSYQNGTEDDFKDSSPTMEMPKTPKELESFIKEYLSQHASLSVLCDQDGDGHLKVRVGLWLDKEEIADASDATMLP